MAPDDDRYVFQLGNSEFLFSGNRIVLGANATYFIGIKARSGAWRAAGRTGTAGDFSNRREESFDE
jgi:hypothetical protein